MHLDEKKSSTLPVNKHFPQLIDRPISLRASDRSDAILAKSIGLLLKAECRQRKQGC